MADYAFLKLERRDAVAWLTLNRPERRNALTHGMMLELEDAFAKISAEHRIIGIDVCGETSDTDDARGTAINARTNGELLKFFREKCPKFFR